MTKPTSANLQTCKRCNQLKPVYDFITGRNINMQIAYSQLCKNCRVVESKALKSKQAKIIENKGD